MSLIETLLEKPTNLSIASKYTAMNGIVYLSAGALLILWPGAVQAIFRDRAFVGDEQGLIRALGMAVVVIGWLYLFGGRGKPASRGCVGNRPTNYRAVGPLTSGGFWHFSSLVHLFRASRHEPRHRGVGVVAHCEI